MAVANLSADAVVSTTALIAEYVAAATDVAGRKCRRLAGEHFLARFPGY